MAIIELQPKPEKRPNQNFSNLRQFFQNIGVVITKGAVRSYNFVSGSAGWNIEADGNAEFQTATITGTFTVGASNVIIDGANKRILVNDGTNNRILIGFQSGGF